jgi:hypothetical protein
LADVSLRDTQKQIEAATADSMLTFSQLKSQTDCLSQHIQVASQPRREVRRLIGLYRPQRDNLQSTQLCHECHIGSLRTGAGRLMFKLTKPAVTFQLVSQVQVRTCRDEVCSRTFA